LRKINQKKEKRERNEIYAKRFEKEKPIKVRGTKREDSKYANWCRTEGHPPSCSHNLPSRDEVIAASRKR
jgi:hypothetical protein